MRGVTGNARGGTGDCLGVTLADEVFFDGVPGDDFCARIIASMPAFSTACRSGDPIITAFSDALVGTTSLSTTAFSFDTGDFGASCCGKTLF